MSPEPQATTSNLGHAVDDLTPSEKLMAKAWRLAAADLGIRLTVAGEIPAEDGEALRYVVLLRISVLVPGPSAVDSTR